MGRDGLSDQLKQSLCQFQSTRPHGARRAPPQSIAIVSMFQSTRPHGARPVQRLPPIRDCLVSIHAPAWGATKSSRSARTSTRCFNPRARMGRDDLRLSCESCKIGFNPRARMGRDRARHAGDADRREFQSTRPHGARRSPPSSAARSRCRFNPRARMGRDRIKPHNAAFFLCFNPRARMGRDKTHRYLTTE